MARRYLQIVGTPPYCAPGALLTALAQAHGGGRAGPVGPSEVAFIAERDSFYMATVGESGWPYVQHRGGPTGFLRVLGPTTLAFADLRGQPSVCQHRNLAGTTRLALPDGLREPQAAEVARARAHRGRASAPRPGRAGCGARHGRRTSSASSSSTWCRSTGNCPQHITRATSAAEVRRSSIAAEADRRAPGTAGRRRSAPGEDC